VPCVERCFVTRPSPSCRLLYDSSSSSESALHERPCSWSNSYSLTSLHATHSLPIFEMKELVRSLSCYPSIRRCRLSRCLATTLASQESFRSRKQSPRLLRSNAYHLEYAAVPTSPFDCSVYSLTHSLTLSLSLSLSLSLFRS